MESGFILTQNQYDGKFGVGGGGKDGRGLKASNQIHEPCSHRSYANSSILAIVRIL